MAGQLWSVNTLGGYFYSQNLSNELRNAVQPSTKFRQFADVKDATQQGKKKGDIFTWDVVGNISRGNRSLVETNTVGEGNFTIYQSTMTISERGMSVPYSGKLEALSKFEVRQPVMRALKNDASKDLDALCFTQFKRAKLRAVCQSGTTIFTTNGTATATASVALTTTHVRAIRDYLAERNVPAYSGNDYYAIARPAALRTLKTALEGVYQYSGEGLKMVMNGEIGRYETTRFVEQTNVPRGGAADSTTFSEYTGTADAWNNGADGSLDWMFFFGEDTVAEAVAVPEETRAKIPSDYGRSKGVAWYYLGAFGLVHEQADEARVLMVDSAV